MELSYINWLIIPLIFFVDTQIFSINVSFLVYYAYDKKTKLELFVATHGHSTSICTICMVIQLVYDGEPRV
jgi:hypothetical protein